MQVKEEIFNILLSNNRLRVAISYKIKKSEVNVYRWAQRKSVPSWHKKAFLAVMKKEMQLSEVDIYEPKTKAVC